MYSFLKAFLVLMKLINFVTDTNDGQEWHQKNK